MKQEILKIAEDLKINKITEKEAEKLLIEILNIKKDNEFTLVSDKEPPHNTELLAKSPNGTLHLTSWRPSYNIFSCQEKRSSTLDWMWRLP
jgi:hypothetical protein